LSIIAQVRRLGREGIRNRLTVMRADFPNWLAAPGGRRLALQPWRFAADIRATDIEVAPERSPRPAPAVRIFEAGHEPRPAPALEIAEKSRHLYRMRNAIVLPRHIILDGETQRVVPRGFIAERYFIHPALHVRKGDVWAKRPVRREHTQRIDGPVLVVDSTHTLYGHVLLEIVTRLYYLRYCPPDTRVLTSLDFTPTYRTLFEALGVPADRIVRMEGPTFCDDAFFGDSLVDIFRFVSPGAWPIFRFLRRIGARSAVEPRERIYVTRRGVGRRALLNEPDVERLFERYGFAIVRPETLAIEDQVKLFTHARMVAGTRGSALHNIVFSAPDTRCLVLTHRGLMLEADRLLMRRDDALAIALGDPANGDDKYVADWNIDLDLVERALRTHFGL